MHDHDCPICGGESTLLGALGRLLWFVCRYCGAQFSEEA